MNDFRCTFRAFIVAVLATILMAVVRRFIFVPVFEFTPPIVPALLAVMMAGWLGGLRSGLFAIVLNAGSIWFLSNGEAGFPLLSMARQFRLVMFVLTGGLVTWGIESLRSARQRLEDRQRELEQEVAERRRVDASEREQRERLAAEMRRREDAEHELREREETLRVAAESGDIGIWDFNPRTGEHKWSARSKTMLGLPPDAEVTTESFLGQVYPEDRERVYQAVLAALDPSGGGKYEVEYRVAWGEGMVRWMLARGQATFEGTGSSRRATRGIGTVIDITERKRSEETLRQAEERFRKLATYAPVGIFQTDAQGRCLFVNDTWCNLVGARLEDALGDGWQRFVHPDDRRRIVAEWRDATTERRNQVSEFRVRAKDGGDRWVVASASIMLDPTGAVSGYVGTVVDMTERKAIEDSIRASELRLQAIMDNTSAVIYLKDAQGRYLMVNRRYEELFHVTQQQIIGRTDADLFPDDIVAKLQANDRQVRDTGQAFEFEEVVPHTDGLHTYVSVKFPIIDRAGVCNAVGGVSTDISDRKRAAVALEEEQEMLRHIIEVQDHERQLVAYEIHDGLVQYATGALMQLESIQGRVQSPVLAEEIESIVGVLRKTVDEGRRIINDIHATVLDDCGVVAAVRQLIADDERAHLRVEFVPDEMLGRMAPKIEQAVYRITQEALTNAYKHSRCNRVRIELSRRNDCVHLEVRDWGVGFTPPARPTGVHGLRGMTERARIAGGQCTVTNAAGGGTQVIVDLPYAERAIDSVEDVAARNGGTKV
ncbi:MAG: PAS domain S-box protein [Planctomycetia bacterium]|nr:PAS domain S-box protein [Planctomycetia bacterium]